MIIRELDEGWFTLSSSNPWKLLKLFFSCQNEVPAILNHCLIMVAMERWGWSLSSYCGNSIFFSLVISARIRSKKVLILFDWTFLLQMWSEIPPHYQVMKDIFPLFVPDCIGGLWLTTTMNNNNNNYQAPQNPKILNVIYVTTPIPPKSFPCH